MPSRSRFASRLTLWAFAAALVLKSGVPLLAAAAAGLQGKDVADVCLVYGVRLTPSGGHAGHVDHSGHTGHAGHVDHATAHAVWHVAGMDTPAAGGQRPSHPEPGDPAAHTQDHCALTSLAAGAVDATTAGLAMDRRHRDGVPASGLDVDAQPQDASARWLTWRLHAPPRSA